ncbi:Putative defensin-like protein 184 [Linum perenne]
MAKSFIVCFLLVLTFFSSLNEMKMMVAAKDCITMKDCLNDKKCKDDCKTMHNGVGICDRTDVPSPLICTCTYKC